MRIERKTEIEAPQQRVWDHVNDPQALARFMEGITRWDVEGDRDRGLGARYTIRMQVGSAQVGGLIEIVECDEPRELAWTSVTGLDHRGRWRLRPAGRGRTAVTLRLAYQAPGGLLATLADRLAARVVRRNIERSLERLKRELEDAEPPPAGAGGDRNEALGRLGDALHAVRVLAGAGLVRPERPDRLVRALAALARFGSTPAASYTAAAVRRPDDIALIDEFGPLTFKDVHRRTNRLARAFSDAGIGEGDGVAVMCRNHRGWVETVVALSKLGANALLLNTSFAGPQLTEVVKRERPAALVYDEEFAELVAEAGRGRKRFVAWRDGDGATDDPALADLCERGDASDLSPPSEPGGTTILTSGTTGTPKGASRGSPGLGAAVSLMSRIPLRARERVLIAAPLFHAWGFAHFSLGLVLGSTLVLQRRFDPEQTLRGIEEHRVTCCPMVPVMLQRILDLPEEVRDRYDTSSLRTVPVSGSALSADLAQRFMSAYGDVLYNLYGSTEVAWATIAAPEDLRECPGTAGPPPRGTTIRILDDDGRPLPGGETGRIFVGNDMLFEGYTGGGSKDVVDGLMATGDVGHLDEQGRLFVEGRDDDMIVSGGENVFPQEVEETLAQHERVADAAVIGVEDERWGQALKAFVVTRGEVSEDDLKAHVKSNLARFKVPREVEFIDELPRNPTGKVLKRELRDGDGDGKAASSTEKDGGA